MKETQKCIFVIILKTGFIVQLWLYQIDKNLCIVFESPYDSIKPALVSQEVASFHP
jgi:hypothetical protein